ncbi:MAG: quinohemoprotein amine dehydrogenase subunit alpha [Gammaproteobacteria bacterium]
MDRNRYWIALTLGLLLPVVAVAAGADDALLRHNCGACHADPANPEAPLSRIEGQRKSPEGWEMTLTRMQVVHKAVFSDPAGELDANAVFAKMLKQLSDTRGLAPRETIAYRYSMERRHNTVDVPGDAEFDRMCARCHSPARSALQRRTPEEWKHLIHFHLAQFPTTEYQAGGRDREWLPVALEKILPRLERELPLENKDWDSWQQHEVPALDGRWRVVGRMPGKGDIEGVMQVKRSGDDLYEVSMEGRFANGETLSAAGDSIIYTGYEWRGNLRAGEERYLQVLESSSNGKALSGRMFLAQHPDRGIDFFASREDGIARLLAVSPAQIRRGESTTLTLSGSELAGEPALGSGILVQKVVSRDADRLVLEVIAKPGAKVGPLDVSVGKATLFGGLTVYERVNRLEVSPAYAVGRVGGNGGSQPEVQARFEAIGWANGPDEKPGTPDDLRIGALKANWSVAPFDEKAAADQDVRFAGVMDKDTGVFMPAAAGPNPVRKYATNNAGNLKVIATLGEGESAVSGEGQLLVTVQRWINPPLW